MLVPGAIPPATGWFLIGALVVALGDWVAVARSQKVLEYACKPGVMLLLAASAVSMHPVSPAQRAWFVAALLLGMVGDVFLMLPRERFIAGLCAFLVGHLAYAAGFLVTGLSVGRAVIAGVLLAGMVGVVLPRVLRGLDDADRPRLIGPLVAYALVISIMVAAAFASRSPWAVAPALLFMVSDTLIAVRKFLAPRPWMPLAVITTYHLAQVGLVLSLAKA